MTPLRERIDTIYAGTARNIRPFIGSAFTAPRADDLRVMAIGINAYVGGPYLESISPTEFERWFAQGSYRFQRAVFRDVSLLAGAVTRPGSCLAGRAYRSRESIFHTNAIKAYLPEARGKRADQLAPSDFEPYVVPWHEELDAMAERGVLPHVVVIFGRLFWETAWRTFHAAEGARHQHLKVLSYETRIPHHLAVIEVEGAAGRHPLLLVEVRHPAARRKESPKWLIGHAEFAGALRPPIRVEGQK
jgi:hypothetical protein